MVDVTNTTVSQETRGFDVAGTRRVTGERHNDDITVQHLCSHFHPEVVYKYSVLRHLCDSLINIHKEKRADLLACHRPLYVHDNHFLEMK